MEVMARLLEIEVKRWHGAPDARVFGWQRMSVVEAFHLKDETFRCPECLGRVKIKALSAEPPMELYGEHYRRNKGCSLGDCFDGTKKLHPVPLN